MGFKGFLATLYSPSFQTFITRKIAGGLYIALVWITTVGIAGFGLFGAVYLATNDQIGSAILLLVFAPISLLVAVIALRLVFESSIALIVIAENTTKD
jgi:hypothetical protein